MSNGHGGGLPSIKALWETLVFQEYADWHSYALYFRNRTRRRKDGFPWIRKSALHAWSAFVKVNGLLYSVGLPLTKSAPKSIYAPDIPGNFQVTYTPTQFNLTWTDPAYTNGTAKIRVWTKPPPLPPVMTPGATIQAIVDIGVQAHTITGFWHKGTFYTPYQGIWRFWLDCVNEHGVVSGSTHIVLVITHILGLWDEFKWKE